MTLINHVISHINAVLLAIFLSNNLYRVTKTQLFYISLLLIKFFEILVKVFLWKPGISICSQNCLKLFESIPQKCEVTSDALITIKAFYQNPNSSCLEVKDNKRTVSHKVQKASKKRLIPLLFSSLFSPLSSKASWLTKFIWHTLVIVLPAVASLSLSYPSLLKSLPLSSWGNKGQIFVSIETSAQSSQASEEDQWS